MGIDLVLSIIGVWFLIIWFGFGCLIHNEGNLNKREVVGYGLLFAIVFYLVIGIVSGMVITFYNGVLI